MLLNGWKEIAAYLKCGIRTAQRWQRDLHMPVMRVRDSKRGPVIAESELLNEWMARRSTTLKDGRLTNQFRTLKEHVMQGYDFLWMELATGRSFVKLAQEAINDNAAARRKKAARKAYDSIQRHLSFTKTLQKAELNQFESELQKFKSELEKLGER